MEVDDPSTCTAILLAKLSDKKVRVNTTRAVIYSHSAVSLPTRLYHQYTPSKPNYSHVIPHVMVMLWLYYGCCCCLKCIYFVYMCMIAQGAPYLFITPEGRDSGLRDSVSPPPPARRLTLPPDPVLPTIIPPSIGVYYSLYIHITAMLVSPPPPRWPLSPPFPPPVLVR